MKWFKKLFLGKFEKQSEDYLVNTKREPWISKFDSLNPFKPEDGCSIAIEALEYTEVITNEVYALTTIRNFRGDTLDEFVCESDWVFVTKKQITEPKFQRHLAETNSLTVLCKTLAEKNVNKKFAEVIARSPTCQCDNRKAKIGNTKTNNFQRTIKAVKNLFHDIVLKIKYLFKRKKKETDNSCEEPSRITDFTKNYLCMHHIPFYFHMHFNLYVFVIFNYCVTKNSSINCNMRRIIVRNCVHSYELIDTNIGFYKLVLYNFIINKGISYCMSLRRFITYI